MSSRISGLPRDLNKLAKRIHQGNVSAGWWKQIDGVTQPRNVGELLCLIHSEIDEADTYAMDDKLPHRQAFEVELADAAIRIFDMLGYYECDIEYTLSYADPYQLPVIPDRVLWLMQMHKATSESMEAFRKTNVVKGMERLVQVLALIHHSGLIFKFDIAGAIQEKLEYNLRRADHKLENRAKDGGKKF